jgi:agmatinase|uniref:Agmatinase n=1 Tax=candidate division WOR-3 bacterium TaxID=2052148 RepID=A0A7V3VUR1_UNCW3
MIIEYANSNLKEADIAIIGLPYDRTSSFIPGSRLGPRYIRICTENIEWFSPYQNRSLSTIKIADLGDYEFHTEEQLKEIEEKVSELYKENRKTIFLGGEHTITPPIIKGINKIIKRFSVIHFDAHADLRNDYHGERFSHATAIRRVADIIGLQNIYQFGIRSGTEEEFSLNKNLFKFSAFEPLSDTINKIPDPIYVTIDVDVVDPSQIPAVATPEPNGITIKELINSLLLLKGRNIIGADIVEYNPLATSPYSSGSAVAVILRELIFVMVK